MMERPVDYRPGFVMSVRLLIGLPKEYFGVKRQVNRLQLPLSSEKLHLSLPITRG